MYNEQDYQYQRSTYGREYHRGEIYYIYRDPNINYPQGHMIDPKQGRPAIIISDDNSGNHTLMVVYLTRRKYAQLFPNEVEIKSTSCSGSIAKCSQITTIDKSLIGDYVGELSDDDISNMDYAIATSLGLYDDEETETPITTSVSTSTITESDYIKVTTERDTYKTLYYELLNKLKG